MSKNSHKPTESKPTRQQFSPLEKVVLQTIGNTAAIHRLAVQAPGEGVRK